MLWRLFGEEVRRNDGWAIEVNEIPEGWELEFQHEESDGLNSIVYIRKVSI